MTLYGALVVGTMLTMLCQGTLQGASAQEGGGAPAVAPPVAPRSAYLERGDQVEARYGSYRERLKRFFDDFGARLEVEAPELLAKLREAPPGPIPYGYGILPKFLPNPPRNGRAARLTSGSFSWRRTEGFIDRDLGRLEKLEARLGQTAPQNGGDRRWDSEKMVDEYRTLAANQKLIVNHIQYNRLWQGEIARNRHGYDLNTALHDAVLERQALQDTLQAGDQVLEPYLHARAETLSHQIREATEKISPLPFVRVEQPSRRSWIVRVPLYTDIEDRSFVDAIQSTVENEWHVVDGEDEFRVAVDVHYVPVSQLYPDGDFPRHGQHIDLAQHMGRFPAGGTVLTTGANNTYVLIRGIVVGPHDIASNIFAHEFGHILGFADGYFRGYRDRGPEGFEVLELVIDLEDIMSAPGGGRVWRHHFERLLDSRRDR